MRSTNPRLAGVVYQTAHGFSVGNVLKTSGGVFALAKADSAANAEVVGIVSSVPDANTFYVTQLGLVVGLSGLTADTVYYLSAASAGALTATEPTTVGQVSKPLLLASTTTAGYFVNYRGILVSGAAAGLPYVVVTGTSQNCATNTKYQANNAGLVTFTLPATANLGDQVLIRGFGSGGWKLNQNASQVIHGASNTTIGTGGSLASQARYDCVTVECCVANTDFQIINQRGTLTTV